MKINTRVMVAIITLIILFGLTSLFNSNFHNSEITSRCNLKKSGYWEIGPIQIDDDNPSNNWLITEATYDWCTGSGTINDPYLIENVTINGGGSGICIEIIDSSVEFIIRNCTLFNAFDGIYLLRTQNGQLINNSCSNIEIGIHLYVSSNNLVSENVIKNTDTGVMLSANQGLNNYNTVINNTITNNTEHGIHLVAWQDAECNYNNIWNNTIRNNGYSGVRLEVENFNTSCNLNSIKLNKISYNGFDLIHGYDGISLDTWRGTNDYNQIIENFITNNYDDGISLHGHSSELTYCSNNLIEGNFIYNNSENGISLAYSDNNRIQNNILSNNSLYGILLDTEGKNTISYNNTFVNNTVTALDSGTGNQWDYKSLGNYWDDYMGVDANDDGIGDTPYDVPPVGESVDHYPLWDDGDDLSPDITINSPTVNDAFGIIAPDFDITLADESQINMTWYTIDGGMNNYTFSGLTGTINQTAWDSKGTEAMTLRFYANDSLGHVGFQDVIIWKDVDAPQITINNPTPNQLCGIDAPAFSLTITEPNILTKKYSLNGRPNVTFTSQTQFDQTEWDATGNGTVSITFYVIDKAGNINSSQVTVRKDAILPDITIHSPIPDEVFEKSPPEFNISIIEDDLISTWYTIEGIAGTFTFTGETGTINEDAWIDVPEGEVTITFFAIDNAGNIGTESVVITKSIPSQPISGYHLFFLLGILMISYLVVGKRLTKKRYKC